MQIDDREVRHSKKWKKRQNKKFPYKKSRKDLKEKEYIVKSNNNNIKKDGN